MSQSDCADIQAQKEPTEQNKQRQSDPSEIEHDRHRIISLYVNCCAYILIQQLRNHIDNHQIELSNMNLLNCLKRNRF